MSGARGVRVRLEGVLGLPFTDGNRVTPLRNGDEIFPAMLEAIRAAESTVEMVTFVYWTGEIAETFARTLADRARAGLDVRVVLDSFGAHSMSRALVDGMEEAGVKITWFRPLGNWKLWTAGHRTHRKVLVVDQRIGFAGGVGIAEEWEGNARDPSEWRDTHFRIEGPAVLGLRAAFFSNWAETDRSAIRQVVDSEPLPKIGEAAVQVVRGTASFGWSDIATVLDGLLALAERRIRIQTAYLAPADPWVEAFREATRRGVEVEIMIPGPHTDKRVSELAGADEIGALIDAGVSLLRYQPTMLHTKVVLVDDEIACIGSANFNQRSLLKDDELALVVIDPGLAATLAEHWAEDFAQCERTTAKSFRARGPIRRLRELVARPVRSNV
jgi:cardiolipin synthase